MRNTIAELDDIDGCIVSLDALHVIEETLSDIRDKQAHYLVSVKNNRANLLAEAMGVFEIAPPSQLRSHTDKPKTAHGRVETRSIKVIPFTSENPLFTTAKTAMVVHRRTRNGKTGKVTEEDELYISSLDARAKSAEQWLAVARGHWTIENGLHYVKDRSMKEDRCTAQGTTAVNMSSLRSLTVNLLKSCGLNAARVSDGFKANSQKAFKLIFGAA